jgi:hypothetical protein
MRFSHHGLEIELEDEWWIAAGMTGFVPTTASYRRQSNDGFC